MDLTCPASARTALSSNFIPTANLVNPLNVVGASLPLLFGLLGKENTMVEGFIKQISVGSSYNWYMHLTQFESIFLGIIFLQILVLRAVGILPVQLNKWFGGDPTGKRRKRRSISKDSKTFGCENDFVGESAFNLLRKLDDQECLLRALCVIQSETMKGYSLPKKTKALLSALKMSSKRRTQAHSASISNPNILTNDPDVTGCPDFEGPTIETKGEDGINQNRRKESGIRIFEEAVMTGVEDAQVQRDGPWNSNSTASSGVGLCGKRYRMCSLSSDDIIHYFDIIANAGML